MYKRTFLFTTAKLGFSHAVAQHRYVSSKAIKTNKILVVSKLSRYEFEKKKHGNLADNDLLSLLKSKGRDTDKLIYYHDLHKKFQDKVVNTLRDMRISVEVINRFSCTEEYFEDADIIMPVGGDGTFLLAASHIHNNVKPVIGLNSDPNRSEGHLCLPKQYSTDVRPVIERLQNGNFEWLMRSRIRTSMIVYDDKNLVPHYIHDIEGDCPEKVLPNRGNILPVLALNEVFMGETMSARVSHLNLRLDGASRTTNVKCSGVCAATGTGSTSWHLSINRLPPQDVADILRLIDIDPTEGKDSLATVLAEIYNRNLVFRPDDLRMTYTIRDLVSAGVWPDPKGIKARGFVSKLEITSNCSDASLVIDGGVAFSFNDGTRALLEIRPEDSLRTVVFKD